MNDKKKSSKSEENDAQRAPTPGAGVNPAKVIRGTKRLKNAYRKYCSRTAEGKQLSFRTWMKSEEAPAEHVKTWLEHKAAPYTKEARKSRKDRVAVLRSSKKKSEDGKSKKG